jgi:hypothetical protein
LACRNAERCGALAAAVASARYPAALSSRGRKPGGSSRRRGGALSVGSGRLKRSLEGTPESAIRSDGDDGD